MRGENGRAIRLIGAVRDITRRKLAEFKLIAVGQAAERARQQLTGLRPAHQNAAVCDGYTLQIRST